MNLSEPEQVVALFFEIMFSRFKFWVFRSSVLSFPFSTFFLFLNDKLKYGKDDKTTSSQKKESIGIRNDIQRK